MDRSGLTVVGGENDLVDACRAAYSNEQGEHDAQEQGPEGVDYRKPANMDKFSQVLVLYLNRVHVRMGAASPLSAVWIQRLRSSRHSGSDRGFSTSALAIMHSLGAPLGVELLCFGGTWTHLS